MKKMFFAIWLTICLFASSILFAECYYHEFPAFGIDINYCFDSATSMTTISNGYSEIMSVPYSIVAIKLKGQLVTVGDGQLFLVIDGKPFSVSIQPWEVK